ncbi:Tetratricopeptide repeat-containing protein [Fibrobacter intestinalis]|uniref:Tetratricopeptide repeat-containing protein n=1 Tax=Fibrobacter intestinalis TaxID=28122 RepID=A0A1M6X937_9BACT|nr:MULTISPECIES: tetratricopeptide repeat protein [Fibrobacter]MDD7299656.1 tetratricopeptide repeat protein [Fibrobacter intestinalis]PBC66815.1 tetratricopeptide repeat protein [Fibrobacter sp. UWS1]SHL02456.1 Tetratricopeptide repeat-containing protein [Fibrobacter intestinalis]
MEKVFFRIICVALFLGFAFGVAGCNSLEQSGSEALQVGDYDRAMKAFSAALDKRPADRNARYGMALACFGKAESAEKIGQHSVELWTKTLSEFAILAKIDSSLAREMHSSALFYLARAKVEENPRAKVLGILNRSLDLDSTNYFSLNLKALVLQKMGENDLAQKIFTGILSENPDFAPAYSNLGNLYWELGSVEDAWDVWSLGAAQFPQNRHLQRWMKVAEDSLKAMELRKGKSRGR